MKVALINNFPPYSGTGRYPYELWNIFKQLSEVEADLYCTHVMEQGERDWPENQGVKFLHKRAYKEAEWASRLAIYFLDHHRVPKKYDLYHITSHMLGHFVPHLSPCVITVHDLLQFKYPDKLPNPVVSLLYNRLLRRSVRLTKGADKIICVSNWTRQQVINQFGVDSTKVVAIHNGVNHQVFKPGERMKARHLSGLPENKRIILHVGSETKRKNIPVLLKALALLVSWGEDVVLIRIGEKTEPVHRLIKSLHLVDRVFHYNHIPEDRLPLYYQGADILMMPSLDEGFGFPLVEAMACGTPVITSDHGPMLEIVADAGLTANAHDFKEFAQKSRSLLRDQGRLVQVSRACFERSLDFDWGKCAEQVSKVYEEVLRR